MNTAEHYTFVAYMLHTDMFSLWQLHEEGLTRCLVAHVTVNSLKLLQCVGHIEGRLRVRGPDRARLPDGGLIHPTGIHRSHPAAPTHSHRDITTETKQLFIHCLMQHFHHSHCMNNKQMLTHSTSQWDSNNPSLPEYANLTFTLNTNHHILIFMKTMITNFMCSRTLLKRFSEIRG